MEELKGLDWNLVVERLKSYATSTHAKELLQEIKPLDSENSALECSERVVSFAQLLDFGSRPFMESLDLYLGWHPRLKRHATLTRMELKDVRLFCRESLAFKEYVNTSGLGDTLYPDGLRIVPEEPLSAIDQILTGEGDIRGDASEKIYQLTQEKTQQTRMLQNTLDKLVRHHQMEPLLQDKYVTTREGRWVLPIKSGMRHGLDGIIHSTSQTKQTVFMEPESLVPMNNRLRQIEVEMEEEIERLLTELSHYLFGCIGQLQIMYGILEDADVNLAKAQLAKRLNATRFYFSTTEIDLQDLRHPLLSLNTDKVVPNTVKMNFSERLLLLSGPNAGGKTVLLKSIGLAAQMARCGLPIPAAEGSKLPFFKNILSAVGDLQSVDANLSTFAAHLKALDHALKVTGSESLVLIDEICGSTDPEEGAALARSFIESYLNNKIFAIITSHLGALKSGWDQDGLIHGSLEFNKERGPTYTLIKGIPGQSLAIYAAKRTGVDPKVITRATELLSPELRKYQTALEEVEELKTALHRLQQETLVEKKDLAAARKKYESDSDALEKDKAKILDKIARKAEGEVEKLLQEAQVKGLFQKHAEADRIKFELPKVVKMADVVAAPEPTTKIESAKDFFAAFPSGSKVFVQSLGQDGVVQGAPNAKGEMPILCQSMRMTIPWTQLRPPDSPSNPTQQILRRHGHAIASIRGEDRSVDLRGLTATSAIEKLELALDQAALASEDRIKVIHGHGTDTLKRSIRSYLSRSVYVKRWIAGTKDSGGDGVTWVELD